MKLKWIHTREKVSRTLTQHRFNIFVSEQILKNTNAYTKCCPGFAKLREVFAKFSTVFSHQDPRTAIRVIGNVSQLLVSYLSSAKNSSQQNYISNAYLEKEGTNIELLMKANNIN